MLLSHSRPKSDPFPGGPAAGPSLPALPGRASRHPRPSPSGVARSSRSPHLAGLWLGVTSPAMPHPAQPAPSPPRLPRLSAPGPAPSSRSPWTRGHVSPQSQSRTEGVPMILHTPGESPRATRLRGKPVTLRLASALPPTESRLGDCGGEGAERRRPPAWPLKRAGGRASWHVSTHAHSGPGAPRSRLPGAQSRGPVTGRPAREAARERPQGCVSRRRRVTFCGAGAAPPAWRSRLAAAAASG